MNGARIRIIYSIFTMIFLVACGAQATPTLSNVPTGTATPMPQATATPTASPTEIVPLHPVISAENATEVTQFARMGNGTIRQVAYSPDGELLAIASDIGIYLYRLEPLAEMEFYETPAIVQCVAFSPDGKYLAAGLSELKDNKALDTIVIRSMQDNQVLQIKGGGQGFSMIHTVAFSADGTLIAVGYQFGGVELWKVEDGSLFRAIRVDSPNLQMNALAISPDGKVLATGSSDAFTRLWSVSSGGLIMALGGSEDAIFSVAFSPDGSLLASASVLWGTINIWRTSGGALMQTFRGNSLTYSSLAFSPDGGFLYAVNDGKVERWSLSDASMTALPISNAGSLVLSPDGSSLAVVTAGAVEIWDVAAKSLVSRLDGTWARVKNIAFSPEGSLLAAAYQDGTARLWSVQDQFLVHTLRAPSGSVESVAFSPDGSLVAVGATYGSIQLWDPLDGALQQTLDYNLYDLNPEIYHFHVPTLAFSPDGTILAAGIVHVENPGKSFGRVVLWDLEDGQVLLDTSGGSWVYSVSFSADGSYLAVQGDGNVEVFKPEDAIGSTGYPIAFSTENSAYPGSPATIFSPDDRYLAMAAFSIVLYDRSNAFSFVAGLGANEMHVQSMAFSPDSALLLSGGGDNSLYIWSVLDQKMLKALVGHNSLVTSVSYSQDGTLLASGSWDGTIRLWGVP